MTSRHEPDPRFLDALEWELQSALRRQQTLQSASGMTPGNTGRMLLAAMLLMAFSVSLGAAGAWAIGRAVDGPRRVQVIQRQALMLDLARSRHDAYIRAAEELRALVDRPEDGGAEAAAPVDEEALLIAEERIAAATEQVELLRLSHEEAVLGGRVPDDAITAPPVRGRDFVAERLAVRRRALEDRLAAHAARASALAGPERGDGLERLRAEERLQLARADLDGLDRLAELRASYLRQPGRGERIERLAMLEEARTEQARVEVQLQAARAIRDRLRSNSAGGRLTQASIDEGAPDTTELELRRHAARRAIEHLERAMTPDR